MQIISCHNLPILLGVIPKCASSSIKLYSWSLGYLVGKIGCEPPDASDQSAINSLSRHGHEHENKPFLELTAANALFLSQSEYLRAVFIRDPLERLISVYNEKIIDSGLAHFKKTGHEHPPIPSMGITKYSEYDPHYVNFCVNSDLEVGQNISLKTFLKKVLDNEKIVLSDGHWKPANRLMNNDQFNKVLSPDTAIINSRDTDKFFFSLLQFLNQDKYCQDIESMPFQRADFHAKLTNNRSTQNYHGIGELFLEKLMDFYDKDYFLLSNSLSHQQIDFFIESNLEKIL
jgi:hypothetical protein